MLSERFIEPHTIDTVESLFLNISEDLDYEDEVINLFSTSYSARCCHEIFLKSNFAIFFLIFEKKMVAFKKFRPFNPALWSAIADK